MVEWKSTTHKDGGDRATIIGTLVGDLTSQKIR